MSIERQIELLEKQLETCDPDDYDSRRDIENELREMERRDEGDQNGWRQ